MDECCYIYGSFPYNNSVCVPEGQPVVFNYIIYNPHDNSTNLTVTWFRTTTNDTSSSEIIPAISEGHKNFSRFSEVITLSSFSLVENCSRELYRDTSSLTINYFTREKDGYYWCQLSINNTLVQSSHGAWLYAGNCTPKMYFRRASSTENQCAKYVNTHAHTTKSSQKEQENDRQIIYVAGGLGALVLVFGALVIALSVLYICKFWNRSRETS